MYPMSCLRDLNSISGLSLLGMLCLVAGVVAILAHGIQAYGGEVYSEYTEQSIIEGHTASVVYVPLWPQTLQGAGAFMGVTIFCFDICSLAFPIEDSMRTKADFSKAVIYALSAVWLVYVLLGNIGAVLYVHDGKEGVRENILSNLPVHSSIALLVRWAMACVSTGCCLSGFVCIKLIWRCVVLLSGGPADLPHHPRPSCADAGALCNCALTSAAMWPRHWRISCHCGGKPRWRNSQ